MDALKVLERLGGGHFMDDLHAAILDVADDVVATGNTGVVTVTLKIAQATKGEPTITVSEEITRKPPKDEAKGAFFFAVDGALHREDPRQAKFELHTVEGASVMRTPASETPQVREVGD